MSNDQSKSRLSSFWSVLWRMFLFFLVIIIVIGAVFAAVYYVAPYLYQEYIQPVQKNTMQIDSMTGQLELIVQETVTIFLIMVQL